VAQALRAGDAELGFVEGPLDAPDLVVEEVAGERMGLFAPAGHPWGRGGGEMTNSDLRRAEWVFREEGSGTRAAFLAALGERGVDVAALNIVLTLPSNEAVREAVVAGAGVTCLSPMVCASALRAGLLCQGNLLLGLRRFNAVRQKERYASQSAAAFLAAAKSRPGLLSAGLL